MADKLNYYFVGVGQTLAAKVSLSTRSFRKYLKPPPLNSFSSDPSYSGEVISIGYSLRTTHSNGPDYIDPCIANSNKLIALLAAPLSGIINCSFSTGVGPPALKIAKVVPIFKQSNREDMAN